MAETISDGRYPFCPNGSHLALYDDQQVYFDGLIQFIQDVSRRMSLTERAAVASSPARSGKPPP
jgi:hypothetical protein